MLRVALIFELLRGHPRTVFWLTTLTQAALWWIVPSLFYAAPPGQLPFVLAIGHEFQLGSYLGPPLAFWLAEIAYDIGGMPGVYLLSQLCVIATYWAVFELGRATVGLLHATIAVMLMVGVVAFSVPTPEFGPPILAMALTALLMLHFWRAAAQGKRAYWVVAGIEAGLLLQTTYAGLIVCVTLVAFMVITQRGRALLGSIEPWLAAIAVVIIVFPHLLWLEGQSDLFWPAATQMGETAFSVRLSERLALLTQILLAFGGLIVLIVLGLGIGDKPQTRVPEFVRPDVHPFARDFIYTLAIAPLVIAVLLGIILGESHPFGGTAPMIVLSTLALVLAAGVKIKIYRQHLLSLVWGAMLVAPPVLAIFAVLLLPPITGTDFVVTQPANAIGRYFSDAFQRRTGHVLTIAAGEPRLAALVALASRPRAHLYLDATPERSPWIDRQELSRSGAVIVWSAPDTTGEPPADIKTRFPGLTPDVPRAFSRFTITGGPTLRVGWEVQRPAAAPQ
jgi:4-amino-4-deoxy-L-arabinose transferase-like glycosyltransferase